jgi:DeoR family fructose operon transcriptional repressor
MSGSSGISANQRRAGILETLGREGRVNVTQLTQAFHTSDTTIRSDLRELEREGLLRRVHGGAVSLKKAYNEMSSNDRMNINKNEKIGIAKACAALIKDGDTLMIDSGTTTRCLAKELAERGNLTVVTDALLIAQEFVYDNSVNVILLGGHLDLQYQFVFGNDAVAQLQTYRADKMVISTDGVSVEHGLTTYHHQEADVSRQMIGRANQVIAIADHSKIGKEGFSYIAPLSSIHTLVTVAHTVNETELEKFRMQGIEVIEVIPL